MAIQKAQGIVLKKVDFRETSLIVTFLTREFGKVTGILKGIRKDPRKFSSSLDLFSMNEIIFYQKRNSHIHLVSQCDLFDNFTGARLHLSKLGTAGVMVELLDSVMPQEDPHPEVFDLTLSSLKELEASAQPEKILTIFKIKVLTLSGFKPHFDSCVSCGTKIIGESKFSLRLGGLLCRSCYRKDLSSRILFRGTIASLLHIQRNNFRTTLNLGLNPQIKRELELVLNAFLEFHLEKELRAERVVRRMESATATLAL